jgi:hypothetical protein
MPKVNLNNYASIQNTSLIKLLQAHSKYLRLITLQRPSIRADMSGSKVSLSNSAETIVQSKLWTHFWTLYYVVKMLAL